MKRSERGQSLTEFALILPLFVLVTIGIVDAGRAIYAYNTVSNAARAAARVAIVNQDATTVRDAAKAHGAGLSLSDTDIILGECSTFDCKYTVTVTYPFTPVTPILGEVFHPVITSTAEMYVENPNP